MVRRSMGRLEMVLGMGIIILLVIGVLQAREVLALSSSRPLIPSNQLPDHPSDQVEHVCSLLRCCLNTKLRGCKKKKRDKPSIDTIAVLNLASSIASLVCLSVVKIPSKRRSKSLSTGIIHETNCVLLRWRNDSTHCDVLVALLMILRLDPYKSKWHC
ncbi:hypothetical protein CJ030_MR7G027347 [Morella rubra]|uniref:Uncharacterized protein n=1 Tax=Morella rubra TaxID=262757 RepID=A0A6A1VAQ3_9ROSI|nr:hypothetical protein CJ030_MR7G027347 [Morella rubra]